MKTRLNFVSNSSTSSSILGEGAPCVGYLLGVELAGLDEIRKRSSEGACLYVMGKKKGFDVVFRMSGLSAWIESAVSKGKAKVIMTDFIMDDCICLPAAFPKEAGRKFFPFRRDRSQSMSDERKQEDWLADGKSLK